MISASMASKLRLEIMSLKAPPGVFMSSKPDTCIKNKSVICRFSDLQLQRADCQRAAGRTKIRSLEPH